MPTGADAWPSSTAGCCWPPADVLICALSKQSPLALLNMCRGRSPDSRPPALPPSIRAEAPTRMRCSRCCRLLLLINVGGSLCCMGTWWCVARADAAAGSTRSRALPGAAPTSRTDSGVGERGVGCKLYGVADPHVPAALLLAKSGLPTAAPATALSWPRPGPRGPTLLKLLHLLTMPGVPAVLCSPLAGRALRGMRMWLVVRPPAGSRMQVSRLMVAIRSDAASLS